MTTADARFVAIYESHYRDVYGYCRRRTAVDRVDDAVAEVFLVAWRRIDEVPENDEALPWLYAVAYRVLGHQWRSASRQRRLKTKLEGLGADVAAVPEEYVVLGQESSQVLAALSRLKRSDQELLRLTVWEELQHKEIALVLGVSVDAVKKRASRAVKTLAREFERVSKQRLTPAAQEGGT